MDGYGLRLPRGSAIHERRELARARLAAVTTPGNIGAVTSEVGHRERLFREVGQRTLNTPDPALSALDSVLDDVMKGRL